jgi:AcrR family transcriptional regulator
VIAQARRIVAEDGLEALTIGALEQRLDFSRGVITYHFRDKDDLVDAVLQSAIEEIDAAAMSEVQASPTPQAKLGAVLRSMVRGFIERPEAGRILLSFWGRLVADARVRKVNADLYARYRAETRILLEHGREAGAFAAVPADALAALVVGTVIGIATQAYFEPGAIDVESAIEEAHRALLARLAPPQRQRRRAHRETGRQGGASEDS